MVSSLELAEEIYRSARTVAFRGRWEGQPVIVKTPAAEIPDARLIAQYRREFSVLQKCRGLPGVPAALELVESGGQTQLLLEDIGGRALADWLKMRVFTPAEVINLLIQAARALESVHLKGVVHNDVNPANLIWAEDSDRLMLIDFGLSSQLAHEKPDPDEIKGTLHYLAPEQTGRVNRTVDYRADFYALGATAWHLLVGRPPFESLSDPLALIHAHLARDPAPPHSYRPDVPPALSAVVATLLAKDPELRYQSVQGLVEDLQRCLTTPQGFDLRTGDRAVRFAVPDFLYGREDERQRLLDALSEVLRGGRALAFVSGPAGTGKSSLVAELRGPVGGARGAFASGRHEQLKRDQPHQALLSALGEALRQLLAESEAELAAWKSRLASAVGRNSGLLARLVPELTHLLDELHDVPELSSEESRNRTHLSVSALVRALARQTRPLVLFLDDLQWADGASLELLEFLAADPNVEGLLLVGGFRAAEVDAGHPLTRALAELPARVAVTRIEVAELDQKCTVQMVADSCRCRLQEAAPLAALLHEKTAGNPFFLRSLLMRLEREGLLKPTGTGWTWELGAIRAIEVSENVVDLMVGQLREFPPETGQALRMAACFGHRFSAAWLGAALKSTGQQVAAALWPALERGLVVPVGTNYQLVEFGSDSEAWYRFSHDRVQEAAYQLVEPSERPSTHLMLGRLLLEEAAGESDRLFDIMDHLVKGLPCMTDLHERVRFAGLALSAGRRARNAAAFVTSGALLEAGYEALGEGRWDEHYELSLNLLHEWAQAALAARRHDVLETCLAEAIRRARTFADEIPAWSTRLQFLISENRMPEAWKLSDDFLRRTGRKQPQSGNLLAIAWSFVRTRWALKGRTPDQLLHLPETHDPVLRGVQEIQTISALAQSRVKPATIPLGILRDVRTVLHDGLTASGAQCWTGYGLILCKLNQVQLGKRFAQLAMEQVENLGRPDVYPRVACLATLLVSHWTTPLNEVSKELRTIFARSLEMGDTWIGSYAAVAADTLEFFAGAELNALSTRVERQERTLSHYRREETRMLFWFMRRAMLDLLSENTRSAPAWLGESRQHDWKVEPLGHVATLALELQVSQIYGEARMAFDFAMEPCPGLKSPTLGPFEPLYWTYGVVALVRGVEEGWASWGDIRSRLARGRKLLQKWARHVDTRGYRLSWLEAAEARARGRVLEALAAYDKAVSLAREAGMRQDAALICEQAAECCVKAGQERVARAYREEALAFYRQWGAMGKVAALGKVKPTTADSSSGSTGSRVLDLETVLRASQVLSSEIRLAALLKDMLNLAMENAGAERGWMVLRSEEHWVLSASAAAGTTSLALDERLDLDDASCPVPGSILRYTGRTREPMVLEDASGAGLFRNDPYVRSQRPRSVLCLPLEHARRLAGLIYLENNRAAGMFTPERTEVLRTLSAQMAICIENARHFEQVQAQHDQILAERERRHVQELRGQAMESRKDALAAFLGIASHDLKNPLAAIGMWAHQLEAGAIRDHIQTACRRASSLIGTYLDVVAMETGGQLKLNRRPCNVGELVEQELDFLLQSLSPADRSQAALEWDLEPLRMEVDPERMQQVVGNLVGNALKYCPAGTPIRVTLLRQGEGARLEVEDEGPGMSLDRQVGLFQPFERRSRDFGGSGLGLWICRVIVEAHGGRIGLHSEPGRGSRFWCEI